MRKHYEITDAFDDVSANRLLDAGGVVLKDTDSVAFLKADVLDKTPDRVVAYISADDLFAYSDVPDLRSAARMTDKRKIALVETSTTSPSRRPDIPKVYHNGDRIVFASGAERAALLLKAGASAVPVECHEHHLARIQKQGIQPQHIRSTSAYPDYASPAVYEIFRTSHILLESPVAAAQRLEQSIGAMIETFAEVRLLLDADVKCQARYEQLRYEACLHSRRPLVFTQDTYRQLATENAQFHMHVIDTLTPFLHELRRNGHDTLPVLRDTHLPTHTGQDPRIDTTLWIIAAREKLGMTAAEMSTQPR